MMWTLPLQLDHDLFTLGAGTGPHYRIARASVVAAPVDLDFDPRKNPDSVLVRDLELPVGRAARTLYLLTAGHGGLDARGIAADGTVTWEDGRTQAVKWMVGEHAWPAWAGATGRGADVVEVGTNAGGDVVTASLLTVPLSFPDAPIAKISLHARPGQMTLALLAVTLSDEPPRTTHLVAEAPSAADWFDFPIPSFGGAHGSVVRRAVGVKDGHLAYDDGSRARFWGVNLVREAALPSPEDAEPFARGLRRLGFNLVRPHHVDGEDGLLNPRRGEEGQPDVVPAMLDRFDRFHDALRQEGIYHYAEMWTLRAFLPREGVPHPNDVPVGNKYVTYAWTEWRDAKKRWFRAIYDRVNPYTGLHYKDDPALAVIELANEDSLLVAWHGGALERLPAPHRRRFDELWNGWLRRKYGTDAALAGAWQGAGRVGLQAGETLALESVAREPSLRSRTELYPVRRSADLVEFYGELEADATADLVAFVRGLGFRQPIVCNTSFGIPQADRQLAACDIIDTHVYWDGIRETTVFDNTSMLDDPRRSLEKLAWCQEGKPCTISELQHSFPNRYHHEAPLAWAALAARQDLDAVIWFAWSHARVDAVSPGPDGALDLAGRWSALAQMPVASGLFRGGVAVPKRRFVRWWSPDALLRDLSEGQGLPVDEMTSMLDHVVRTSFADAPPRMEAVPVDPSPLRWTPGRMVVDTPRVQAVIGRTLLPGKDAGALRAALDRFAAVSLVSLDGEMLGSCGQALLTLVGRAEREGTIWPSTGPGALVVGRGRARLERLRGVVDVRWAGRARAWALDAEGQVRNEVKLRRLGGGWWRMDADVGTAWVVLGRGEPGGVFPIGM